jgi:hypothetical protein
MVVQGSDSSISGSGLTTITSAGGGGGGKWCSYLKWNWVIMVVLVEVLVVIG